MIQAYQDMKSADRQQDSVLQQVEAAGYTHWQEGGEGLTLAM